jgi:isopentenyl-diphosphate Delta-isomerase
LGITTSLLEIFDFVYQARVENYLVEHEFDHVFVGEYSGDIPFDEQEVIAVRYVPMAEIKKELLVNPEQFTVWFKLAFEKINDWWNQRYY